MTQLNFPSLAAAFSSIFDRSSCLILFIFDHFELTILNFCDVKLLGVGDINSFSGLNLVQRWNELPVSCDVLLLSCFA